jgi:hypothetical protein
MKSFKGKNRTADILSAFWAAGILPAKILRTGSPRPDMQAGKPAVL